MQWTLRYSPVSGFFGSGLSQAVECSRVEVLVSGNCGREQLKLVISASLLFKNHVLYFTFSIL